MKIYKNVFANTNNITASEYYPENYEEMGYDGLDEAEMALESIEHTIEDIQNAIEGIHDAFGSRDTLEWFGGPSDAYKFASDCDKVNEYLYKAWELLVKVCDSVQ